MSIICLVICTCDTTGCTSKSKMCKMYQTFDFLIKHALSMLSALLACTTTADCLGVEINSLIVLKVVATVTNFHFYCYSAAIVYFKLVYPVV